MAAFPDALRSLDDAVARLREERGVPGLAWGVVRDGGLVHTGAVGTAVDGESRVPDADTVFRIASMTKSFTAAAVLLLRDEGALRLDDAVGLYVPELAEWAAPVRDGGVVTIRQLLTMGAGLPTDDPWGDRQQGLPLDAFARLLAAGPRFAWAPGTAFDYSNLGYGILGRVVTAAAGTEYRDVVRERLLVPLGMASSGYLEEDVPDGRLAHGYVRRGASLVREGRDAYGALAAMGGLYASVRDLARWVAGFTAVAGITAVEGSGSTSEPASPHPLRAASRREMQQIQRAFPAELPPQAPDAPPAVLAGGYGFGLFVTHDSELGTFVGHSGGYPGYGSNMTWHASTGIGVVALGNLRYAGPSGVVAEQLRQLVVAAGTPARRTVVRPWPEVERSRAAIERLLAGWDDAVADAAFAMNLDLDEPRDARRAAVEAVRVAIGGPFRADPGRPPHADSAAHLAWWLRGARGWVRLELLLTPEPEPRIQRLLATAVADPSPDLADAAAGLLAALRDGPAAGRLPRWPASVPAARGLDPAAVERALAAGWARFGAVRPGLPLEGDGRTTATWALGTERGGDATLRIALAPDSRSVASVALLAARRSAPPEAW